VEETAAGIVPHLRAMAQQTWGSEPLVASFAQFEPIVAAVGGPPAPVS
jgi:hexosaminidase